MSHELDDEEMSVFDRAAEEGEQVFAHAWNAHRPGGSGCEFVYRLDGQFYYVSNDYDPGGPYATLDEAFQANEQLIQVNGCTTAIESSLLDDDAIIARVEFTELEPEYETSIEHMTHGLAGEADEPSAAFGPDLDPAEMYLVDGKQFRINQTKYEFRAPAALIPMGPADGDDDGPDYSDS